MGVYGDYAASIIHEQRSRELQAQVRQDRLTRSGRDDGRRSEEREARARAGARPRTV